MRYRNHFVRTAVAIALLGSAAQAFAQTAPYTVTPLTGTAQALSSTGAIASYTSISTTCPSADGLFSSYNVDCCGNGYYYYNGSATVYVSTPSVEYTLSVNGTTLGTVLNAAAGGFQGSAVMGAWAGTGTLYQGTSVNIVAPATGNPYEMSGTFTVASGPRESASGQLYAPYAQGQTFLDTTSQSSLPDVIGVSANGTVAVNGVQGVLSMPSSYTGFQSLSTVSVVYSPNSATQLTYLTGSITGISETNGGVAFTQSVEVGSDSSTQQSYYLANGSTNAVEIANQGYGAISSGVNDSGQVTGGAFLGENNVTSYGYYNVAGDDTDAFLTSANASTTPTYFGVANGVSSFGTSVNDSGQVGGYITLADGADEAFLSSAHDALLVGLGASSLGSDSTETLFVNDSGNAIVEDLTTGDYYYYSSGVLTPISSLDGGATADNDPVVGFNSSGAILLSDPDLLQSVNTSGITAADLLADGGTSITTSAAYSGVAISQDAAPTASFFTDPTDSGTSDFTSSPLSLLDPVTLTTNSAGQTGGYVTYDGQEYAFISAADGGSLVGVTEDWNPLDSSGDWTNTDNTETLFLNSSGEAILEDTTAGIYYFYNEGVYSPLWDIDSTDASGTDEVLGLNNAGQILLDVNGTDELVNTTTDTASYMWNTYDDSDEAVGSTGYDAIAAAEGVTPTAAFYLDPTQTSSGEFVTYTAGNYDDPVQDAMAGSSVPEPGVLSLFGLGALVFVVRRKPAVLGVAPAVQ